MCLVSVRPTQRERVCLSAQPGSRELLGRAVQSQLGKTTVLATHTRSPESALGGPRNQLSPKTIESRPDTGFSPDTGFQLPKTGCENRHAPLSFTCALR